MLMNIDWQILGFGDEGWGGVLGAGSAIGLRKGNSELQQVLNQALDSMIKDGTLSKLSIKWFGEDVAPKA